MSISIAAKVQMSLGRMSIRKVGANYGEYELLQILQHGNGYVGLY